MDHKQELLHWAKVWDKALEKNLFPKTEESVPSSMNANNSFFGLQSRSEDAPLAPLAPDAAYWNKVYQKSKSTGPGVAPDILSEAVVSDKIKAVQDNPNPIKLSTVGMDQDVTPEALDATFSEKDIEDLAELKNKLFELENKLNEFEGRGENAKKFESQIAKVKSQISALSDSMTHSFK